MNLEALSQRICQRLDVSTAENLEVVEALLREAIIAIGDARVAATKAACLQIAEEEAERCRRAGAYPAEQIAMTIAARIRMRHIGP